MVYPVVSTELNQMNHSLSHGRFDQYMYPLARLILEAGHEIEA